MVERVSVIRASIHNHSKSALSRTGKALLRCQKRKAEMQIIIRGTTPVFKYTFSDVHIEDIAVAIFTIKSGAVTIEKTLTDATIGADYLQWQLTQEETISLGKDAVARLNWKKSDGIRGASKRASLTIEENEKEGVI